MRKIHWIVALILLTTVTFAQKEKVKGSKIVTVEQKEIGDFVNIEVNDNLEIFLIKGDHCGLEIEADDNLHELIDFRVNGNTLTLGVTKQVSNAKKFSVRVTYTDDFKMLAAKGESNITALSDLNLPAFTFKMYDSYKFFANANVKNFTLMADDKSKAELNLKAEETVIEMSKNSQLKALISSTVMKFDMYQKSKATLEGDVIDMKLRLDNNSDFTGSKMVSKNAEVVAEAYSECSINVATKLVLDAKGKADIQLYGEQKIEIKNFLDSATLTKKPSK